MKNELKNIKDSAITELSNCYCISEIEQIKIKYIGKKGELSSILKKMGSLSAEERPIIGQLANEIRDEIESKIKKISSNIKKANMMSKIESEKIDVTIPGKSFKLGKKHPITIVLDEIKEIFLGMGFNIVEGPEIESSYYNFEALNIPYNHTARDMSDTFYIDKNTVLRTQTSPVQIRIMENQKPPIRIIAPGRVFRPDSVDATHSPIFHQIEGLVVDKGVRMSDLKGTLETFIKNLYGKDSKIRFRPHHFPFTEPSAEIDIMCFSCKGSGCRICKNEGFIEILGAGMVNIEVLKNCNIDYNIYSGFAFGLGLERIVMRRFNIDDLRLFFENDIRFLNNF